jgi:hypothetical protein
MKNLLIPIDALGEVVRKWFLLPLAMIMGAVIGLILNGFLPSIYEAQAKFVVTIDYTRTGYLSDIQEDQAMRGIGSLIGSDLILKNTTESAGQIGLQVTLSELKAKSILERGEFEWFIRIRDKDARIAASLVNLWAEQADQVLTAALLHSLKAESLFNYLDSLEMCLQRTSIGMEAKAPCQTKDLETILSEIQKVGRDANQEKEASRGLMPAVSVDLVEKGQVPQKPVIFSRNAFVLVGSILGLIIVLLWVMMRKGEERARRGRG